MLWHTHALIKNTQEVLHRRGKMERGAGGGGEKGKCEVKVVEKEEETDFEEGEDWVSVSVMLQ